MVNLELGKSITLKYDPNVCESAAACAAQTLDSYEQQNTMNKALSGGKKRKRKTARRGGNKMGAIDALGGGRRRRKSIKRGGANAENGILLNPLPQGSQTDATNTNNKEIAELFAQTQTNAENDSMVKFGGRKKIIRKKMRKIRGGKKTKRKRFKLKAKYRSRKHKK